MEPNQPKTNAEIDLDKELAEVNRMNRGFVDEDETPVIEPKTPETPVTPPAEITPATPASPLPTEKKDEAPAAVVPVVEPPKPVETTQQPQDRVVRYIPIPQWKEENRIWKEKEAGYKQRITELETIAAKREGTEAHDKRIKEYAETHNLDEAQVRGLLDLASAGKEITTGQVIEAAKPDVVVPPATLPQTPAVPADPAPQPAAPVATAPTPEEVAFFGQEFDSEVGPLIKAQFPDAKPEAIAKVKERIDALAHSKELHRTPLSWIFKGAAEELGKILVEDAADPTPAGGRKGLENYRPGSGKPNTVTAKDFKDSKDFSALEAMNLDDRAKIVRELAPNDYMNYVAYEGSKEQGVTVRRGDKTIVLK